RHAPSRALLARAPLQARPGRASTTPVAARATAGPAATGGRHPPTSCRWGARVRVGLGAQGGCEAVDDAAARGTRRVRGSPDRTARSPVLPRPGPVAVARAGRHAIMDAWIALRRG